MTIRKFAITTSVLALTACAGAQAEQTGAHYDDNDHLDHYSIVTGGSGHGFSSSGMSHTQMLELRREINEDVREELAEARMEIHEALAETKTELAALEFEFDADDQIDVENLSETILMSVQTALQEAQRELERAEKRLARDEAHLSRQAEHMARQAEHLAKQADRMERKAEEMKARAAAMKRKAEDMDRERRRLEKEAPVAPESPASAEPAEPMKLIPASVAPPAGKPVLLRRQALAPAIH